MPRHRGARTAGLRSQAQPAARARLRLKARGDRPMCNMERSGVGHGRHAVAALYGELDLARRLGRRITSDHGRSCLRAVDHRGPGRPDLHRLLRPGGSGAGAPVDRGNRWRHAPGSPQRHVRKVLGVTRLIDVFSVYPSADQSRGRRRAGAAGDCPRCRPCAARRLATTSSRCGGARPKTAPQAAGTAGTALARCGRTAPWRRRLLRSACTACSGGLENLTAARGDYGLVKRAGERVAGRRRAHAVTMRHRHDAAELAAACFCICLARSAA
jgi:hypothetical protein